ncbi:MAG TPA: polysaccharide biosynthesis C-terminal domain-containing protein, partial [bacterium]|nr:polysaccharide biosynthesis C-terminal domain-containing protein [bacterium]
TKLWPSINLLRIYSFSLPGLFLFTALNQYLLAENKEKTIFIANFSGLIINLSLNILLIPRVGLPGAALATVITFIFLPIFMLFSSPKKSEIKL